MNKYSDLATQSKLSGDKIEMKDLLGKQVAVTAFRIGPSKQDIGKRCLTLQMELDGALRIVFTGSEVLMKDLESFDPAAFPFTATIIKESGGTKSWFKFTD